MRNLAYAITIATLMAACTGTVMPDGATPTPLPSPGAPEPTEIPALTPEDAYQASLNQASTELGGWIVRFEADDSGMPQAYLTLAPQAGELPFGVLVEGKWMWYQQYKLNQQAADLGLRPGQFVFHLGDGTSMSERLNSAVVMDNKGEVLNNFKWDLAQGEWKQLLLAPTGLEASLPPKDTPFVIIQPAFVDARDVDMKSGMQFHLEVVTDQTVTDGDYPGQEITKMYLNDAVFRNNYGENAEQSVAHAALQTYLDLAFRSNDFIKAERDAREAKSRKFTLDDYKQWIAEAQAGTRPWEQVEFQAPADRLDGDTGLYKIEQVAARPDWIRVVLVDPTEKEIFRNISTNLRDAGTNLAVATHITKDGTIEIWGGFPFTLHSHVRYGGSVGDCFLIALERMGWSLEENKNGPNLATWIPSKDPKYLDIILKRSNWKSAFAFDPPTDEPWNH